MSNASKTRIGQTVDFPTRSVLIRDVIGNRYLVACVNPKHHRAEFQVDAALIHAA